MTARSYVRTVRVALSRSELESKASQMTTLILRGAEIEAQKKEALARYNAQMSELDAELRALAKAYDEGYEERDLECVDVHDYRRGRVTVRRCDTREEVDERAMTAEERQMPLLEDGGAA